MQFLDWELDSVTVFSIKIEGTFSYHFDFCISNHHKEEGTPRVRFKATLAVVALTPKPCAECSQNQSLNLADCRVNENKRGSAPAAQQFFRKWRLSN